MASKKKSPPRPPTSRSTLIPELRANLTAPKAAQATPSTGNKPVTTAATKPKPPPPARAQLSDTVTTPTAKEKAHAERLVTRASTLRRNIDKNFYALGLTLKELARRDVYRALDFNSFEALLVARGLPSKMQATKLITIVNVFQDEALATTYRVEKAYEVARYIELEHPNRPPAAVIAQNPLIAVGNKQFSLAAITGAKLTAFVRGRLATTDEPDDAKERIEAVARRIGRALQPLGVDPDRVQTHLSKRRGHRLRIELTAEEAEDFLRLIKSLRE